MNESKENHTNERKLDDISKENGHVDGSSQGQTD